MNTELKKCIFVMNTFSFVVENSLRKTSLLEKLKINSRNLNEYAENILPRHNFPEDNEMNVLYFYFIKKKTEIIKCSKKCIFIGKVKAKILRN